MDDTWITVCVESPYAGEVEDNTTYARLAYKDCLVFRHEAPFASHLNYTQPGVLDDLIDEERWVGINAGIAVAARLQRSAFYVDRGFSRGMMFGLENAIRASRPVVFRAFRGGSKSLDRDPEEVANEFGFTDLLPDIFRIGPAECRRYLSPGCP